MTHFYQDIEILAAVVDSKGFARAAKHLKLSPALISRAIKRLEQTLKVSLLTRSTRQFSLTPEGAIIYKHAKQMLADKATMLQAIEERTSQVSGSIKISAPMNLGRLHLPAIVHDFTTIYPDVCINLELSNEKISLIDQNFDLAIRSAGYLGHQNLDNSNLIAKHLISSSIILCASKHYIEQHPIHTLTDIQGLTGIEFNPQPTEKSQISWTSDHGQQQVTLKKSISCNDIDASIQLCLLGGGIIKVAQINVHQALKTGELIEILPEINWGQWHVFAVYPHRNLPQRTKCFIDFLNQRLKTLNDDSPSPFNHWPKQQRME